MVCLGGFFGFVFSVVCVANKFHFLPAANEPASAWRDYSDNISADFAGVNFSLIRHNFTY
jgi:hypothetical protein